MPVVTKRRGKSRLTELMRDKEMMKEAMEFNFSFSSGEKLDKRHEFWSTLIQIGAVDSKTLDKAWGTGRGAKEAQKKVAIAIAKLESVLYRLGYLKRGITGKIDGEFLEAWNKFKKDLGIKNWNAKEVLTALGKRLADVEKRQVSSPDDVITLSFLVQVYHNLTHDKDKISVDGVYGIQTKKAIDNIEGYVLNIGGKQEGLSNLLSQYFSNVRLYKARKVLRKRPVRKRPRTVAKAEKAKKPKRKTKSGEEKKQKKPTKKVAKDKQKKNEESAAEQALKFWERP